MKKNLIAEKSFVFALKIIELSERLRKAHHYALADQILRSGTSIGANVREASAAESRPDFAHKLSIASKEARETLYWLELLRDSRIIHSESLPSILSECESLVKILTASIKTLHGKTKN